MQPPRITVEDMPHMNQQSEDVESHVKCGSANFFFLAQY